MRIDTFAVSSMNCVTGTALEKISSTPTQRKLTTMCVQNEGFDENVKRVKKNTASLYGAIKQDLKISREDSDQQK